MAGFLVQLRRHVEALCYLLPGIIFQYLEIKTYEELMNHQWYLETSWEHPFISPFAGFLKYGYPQIIHLNGIFHEINHPFLGSPILGHLHLNTFKHTLHCKHQPPHHLPCVFHRRKWDASDWSLVMLPEMAEKELRNAFNSCEWHIWDDLLPRSLGFYILLFIFYKFSLSGWWARATPLKNMSQLGWLDINPILMGKYKIHGNQTTNQQCHPVSHHL